jgi:Xaa-Pro aminopeptidase
VRTKLPQNSVALFLAIHSDRANDVDFIFHQDPDFIMTGYKEPNAVLVVFSNNQQTSDGKFYNELLYVQEKPRAEQWTGVRLGTEGAKKELGFENVFNGSVFLNSGLIMPVLILFSLRISRGYRNLKNEKRIYTN